MINLEITDRSIKELLDNNEVDVVVHGCNCFHILAGPIAETLKAETDNDIEYVDKTFSPWGDINNLGTWTEQTYTINDKQVAVCNLYCQYTLSAEGCDPIHWESVYNGLVELLGTAESGQVVAVAQLGTDASSKSDFISILNTLIQRHDDELPDIDIKVVDH